MFAIFLTEGMDPFYQNIGSFPTVFFTFFLLLAVLYWVVAVLGWVEIELLDFDLDLPDSGALDAAGSGLSVQEVLSGLMLKFGLHGVPVTLIVSLIALFGWIVSYYIVHFLFGLVPDGLLRYVAGVPVLLVALYVGVMIASVIIRPLRPLFKKTVQQTEKYVLGQTAVVRTSRLDSGFGQVALDDGGAGLILQARATGAEAYTRGDRVVLLEYLKDMNAYRVVCESEFTGDSE